MARTQQDLDQLRCGNKDCNCHTVILCSQCHPRAPMQVEYDRETGCLTISCDTCGQDVSVIEVAP